MNFVVSPVWFYTKAHEEKKTWIFLQISLYSIIRIWVHIYSNVVDASRFRYLNISGITKCEWLNSDRYFHSCVFSRPLNAPNENTELLWQIQLPDSILWKFLQNNCFVVYDTDSCIFIRIPGKPVFHGIEVLSVS